MKILYFLIASASLVSCDRIVQTNNGPIRGKSVAGGKVEAFLGIPYAEPPVGPLRFAKPVPKSSWQKTLEASSLPPYCVQGKLNIFHFPMEQSSGEMSEDCLFLNLWVPEGGSDQKPIMLFIHGGGYMFGSSIMRLYDGSNLSERGDVIVATINYRVGTLGFFYGFTEEAAGSMGMYDQVMAIQWIKDNARHFRGDADNIVLFGESAGSFSVSLHMVSPLAKNLFKRGILQSGSAFHPNMFSENNEVLAHGSQLLAKLSGCLKDHALLENSGKAVVDCLKNFPAEKISELDLRFFQSHGRLFPRVGDDFLPESPLSLFRKGNFKEDEILIGVTRDEGSILFIMKNITEYGLHGEKVNVRTYDAASAMGFMKGVAKIYGGSEADHIVQSYLNRVKDVSRYSYLHAASDFLGDFIISCGAVFQADFQSLKNTPVYFYVFDYRPASTSLAEWMGVAHLDEVQYVFGNAMYANFTMFEEEFSKDVMDMWIAFAKNGDPSISGGVKWPRYTVEDPKYYIIGKADGVGVRPLNGRCEVWRSLFRAEVDEDVCEKICKK